MQLQRTENELNCGLTKNVMAGLAVVALQLGVVASAHAGGGSILRLPIEGVTEENSDRCINLFKEQFAPVLINWNDGDVKMIKVGSTNLVELRPERGRISLSDVEKALKDSPFTIDRAQLEYVSLVRLRIGKVGDSQRHIDALANLDGKKLLTEIVEDSDGTLLFTLRDPLRNAAVPLVEKRKRTLITHQRLASYLSENKIELIAIDWGHHRLNHGKGWRGDYFGARLADAAAVKD